MFSMNAITNDGAVMLWSWAGASLMVFAFIAVLEWRRKRKTVRCYILGHKWDGGHRQQKAKVQFLCKRRGCRGRITETNIQYVQKGYGRPNSAGKRRQQGLP